MYPTLLGRIENQIIPFSVKKPRSLTFDHADIISPIAYREGDGVLAFLDEVHHHSFL